MHLNRKYKSVEIWKCIEEGTVNSSEWFRKRFHIQRHEYKIKNIFLSTNIPQFCEFSK
jgi:hypothetical protein